MTTPQAPQTRGGWNRNDKVHDAVDQYIAIGTPKRGDMKQIALAHGVPVSSLATHLRRRADRKEIKYPAQYGKAK